MDIRDSEKLIQSFKKNPIVTIVSIVVLVVLVSLVAWFNGFFGAKGKQAAGPFKETPSTLQPSKELPRRFKSQSPSANSQTTEGDQSPIVNVGPGGKSTINYGGSKEKGASE
jgi:hypothetical protein